MLNRVRTLASLKSPRLVVFYPLGEQETCSCTLQKLCYQCTDPDNLLLRWCFFLGGGGKEGGGSGGKRGVGSIVLFSVQSFFCSFNKPCKSLQICPMSTKTTGDAPMV